LSVAHTPPDAEHPYGHGKAEFLSAGFEGGMIFLAAVVILGRTIDALLHHTLEVEELNVGLALITAAMLANGGMGLFLIRLGRRRKSVTLEADGHHLLSDAITTVAALIALFFVKVFDWRLADPIAALLIAVYIGYMGVSLIRRSIQGLMDRQDIRDEQLLKSILDLHVGTGGKPPTICSYHKLRHRHSGRYHWVDLHILLPAENTVEEGHNIASAIEREIEGALGEGKATAHVEPCRTVECPHHGD
jgi:cation diffusion facilitator family transporter